MPVVTHWWYSYGRHAGLVTVGDCVLLSFVPR